MKKFIKRALIVGAFVYVLICGLLYFFQEKVLFFPEKLPKSYVYHFNQPFEENSIRINDSISLNTLLFKTAKPIKDCYFFCMATQAPCVLGEMWQKCTPN